MKIQQLIALTVLAFTTSSCGTVALASPLPQTKKRSASDADINAIGQRRIDKEQNLYPLDKEQQIGKTLSKEVEQTSRLLSDNAVMGYLDRIAQRIAENSDARLPIVARVLDSDLPNSFTLPGGYLYINRGLLLRLEGEAELASVLARGAAHTALRTAVRKTPSGDAMQLAMIPMMIGMPWPGDSMANANLFSIPPSFLKSRQDDELDADYFGVQYVYKAGYDPECFSRFVQRIWASGIASKKKVAKVPSFYPPLDLRLTALQSEINEILPSRDTSTVSTADFDAFIERLRTQKSEELKRPVLRTSNRPARDPL